MRLIQANLSKKHMNFLYKCFNSSTIRGDFQPTTETSFNKIRISIRSQKRTFKYIFVIEDENELIGYAYVNKSQAFCQHEIGVTLIPGRRDKGLGYIAHCLLVKYILNNLKISKLVAYVSEGNVKEIAILSKCYFKCEGIMREAGYVGDKAHNIAIYGAFGRELELRCKRETVKQRE